MLRHEYGRKQDEDPFMKILRTALLGSLLLAPGLASADFIGFAAGVGMWQESPSGTFRKTGDPIDVSLENDLFWGDESQTYFYATLEHPVPLLPNIRLSKINMDHGGSGTLTRSITINGQTFNVSENVTSDASIEQLDMTLYWELLDNVVSLDVGLNAKQLKLDYTVTGSSSGTTSDSFDEIIPMVYGLVGVSPMPGLLISGEMSYVTYSGTTVSDFMAKVAYTTSFFLGVEAGYRQQKFILDDVAGSNSDITFSGPFAGVYLKF